MANKRDIKKDLNYVIGDIIEAVYIWELSNPKKSTKDSEAIIDDAIQVFNELIIRVNQRDYNSAKTHFKSIYNDLETKGKELIERINSL